MMWTMIPGSADGGRPVTHEPLTSLTASSKAMRAVAAGAQLPAERVAVEARRALDIGCGDLEVADLAGCECGGSVCHAD